DDLKCLLCALCASEWRSARGILEGMSSKLVKMVKCEREIGAGHCASGSIISHNGDTNGRPDRMHSGYYNTDSSNPVELECARTLTRTWEPQELSYDATRRCAGSIATRKTENHIFAKNDTYRCHIRPLKTILIRKQGNSIHKQSEVIDRTVAPPSKPVMISVLSPVYPVGGTRIDNGETSYGLADSPGISQNPAISEDFSSYRGEGESLLYLLITPSAFTPLGLFRDWLFTSIFT
ncbi:unnamed protein product, partial [Nesidiocoris tenuis]